MKKILCSVTTVLLMACIAVSASAGTITYGWEDGNTILGSYGTITATNVEVLADPVHSGGNSLKLVDGGGSSTPQAYVGWVTDLQAGDTVTAGFWVYDTTAGESPSGRIWGHYTNTDVLSYAGSASGNYTYSGSSDWSYLEYSWTYDPGTDRNGLVIEARIYGDLDDFIYVDDLTITAPDHATITTPAAPVPLPAAVWMLGSGLFALLGIRKVRQ